MTVSSPLSAHTLNACMRHVSKTETHCGATGIDADAGSTVRQLASLLNSPRLAKSEISKSQMLNLLGVCWNSHFPPVQLGPGGKDDLWEDRVGSSNRALHL